MLRAVPPWHRFLEALAYHQPATYAQLLKSDRLPASCDIEYRTCPGMRLVRCLREAVMKTPPGCACAIPARTPMADPISEDAASC